MPSRSLDNWQTTRIAELDEVEEAHRSVGGSGRGRRTTTRQLNHAYTMLLSSQFQGFCRDLHSEAADYIVSSVSPVSLQPLILDELRRHRRLDSGNPNPGNIGADFNRLGLKFWEKVLALSSQNTSRRDRLVDLNSWRNAIAHHDFDPAKLGGTINLQLATVRSWRKACELLAVAFDRVFRDHLFRVIGTRPW